MSAPPDDTDPKVCKRQKLDDVSVAAAATSVPLISLGHRASDKLLLASVNEHPLDCRIVFVEEGHVYYVDGEALSLSVTGLIESVAGDHFDPDFVIGRMKRGKNWPNPAYSDILMSEDGKSGTDNSIMVPWSDERIKGVWAANGKLAADLGTDLHSKIELYLNNVSIEFTDDVNRKEFSFFVNWWETKRDQFEPYRTEWVIFDQDAKLAGSIDFVMRNKHSGKYYIVDWKRCKTSDSGFSCAYGKKFLPPLNHLQYHKSNKWGVQVNIYRLMLEKSYGIVIEGMCMVVFHEENTKAKVFEYPFMDDVSVLLHQRYST